MSIPSNVRFLILDSCEGIILNYTGYSLELINTKITNEVHVERLILTNISNYNINNLKCCLELTIRNCNNITSTNKFKITEVVIFNSKVKINYHIRFLSLHDFVSVDISKYKNYSFLYLVNSNFYSSKLIKIKDLNISNCSFNMTNIEGNIIEIGHNNKVYINDIKFNFIKIKYCRKVLVKKPTEVKTLVILECRYVQFNYLLTAEKFSVVGCLFNCDYFGVIENNYPSKYQNNFMFRKGNKI
jgi:hypothetical protein